MTFKIVQLEEQATGNNHFEVDSNASVLRVRYPALHFLRMYGVNDTDELFEAMINFRASLEVRMRWNGAERSQVTKELLRQLRGQTSERVIRLVEGVLAAEEVGGESLPSTE